MNLLRMELRNLPAWMRLEENIELISKKPSYALVVASQKLSPETPQQQLTVNHAAQKQVNIPHVPLMTSNENENLQKTQSFDFSNLVGEEEKEYENIVLPKISEFNNENDIEIIQKKISYANAVKNPQVFQKCQNEPLPQPKFNHENGVFCVRTCRRLETNLDNFVIKKMKNMANLL